MDTVCPVCLSRVNSSAEPRTCPADAPALGSFDVAVRRCYYRQVPFLSLFLSSGYNMVRHDAVLGWLTGRWPSGSQASHGSMMGPDALRLGVAHSKGARGRVWCLLALRGRTKYGVYYFRAQLGWAWPIMDSILYECGPRTSTRTVVIGRTGQSSEVFHHVGTRNWLKLFLSRSRVIRECSESCPTSFSS